MKNIVLTGVISVLALALLGYGLFPFYVPVLTGYYAKQNAITVVDMKVGYPSFNKLELHKLVLEHKAMGELQVLDIVISYDFPEFIPTLINIKSIELTPETTPPAAKQPPLTRLSSLLPNTWITKIPNSVLAIERISGLYAMPSITQLKLEKQQTELTLAASTTLPYDIDSSIQKELAVAVFGRLTADNRLTIDITKPADEKRLAHFESTISKESSVVKADIALWADLAAVPLAVVYPEFDRQLEKGQVNAALTLELPDQVLDRLSTLKGLVLDLSMELKAKDKMQIEVIAAVNAKATLNEGHWEAILSNPTTVLQDNVSQGNNSINNKVNKNLITLLLPHTERTQVIEVQAIEPLHFYKEGISSGSFLLEYRLQNKKLATLTISNLALTAATVDAPLNLSYRMDAAVNIPDIVQAYSVENIKLDTASFTIAATGILSAQSLLLTIEPASQLLVQQLQLGETVARDVQLSLLPKTLEVFWDAPAIKDLALGLSAGSVISGEQQLIDVAVKGIFAGELNSRSGRLGITIEPFALRLAKDAKKSLKIPAMLGQGGIDLSSTAAQTAAFILRNACNEPLVTANWQQQINQPPIVKLHFQHTFSSTSSLRHWLNYPLLPIDFTQGELMGDITWSAGSVPAITLALQQGAGIASIGSFDGVQLGLSSATIESTHSGQLDKMMLRFNGQITALDMGFPARNIQLRASVENDQQSWRWNLQQFKAQVFDGTIKIIDQKGVSGAVLDKTGEKVHLNMLIDNVDIEPLVATQQLKGLVVTGRLSGELPIIIDANTFTLDHGELKNTRGGVIRYQSTISDSENLNEQLQLTLDILKNFNYNVLDTRVNYDNDLLKLQSAISGKNPDVAGGQQVNVNLNTEINMKSAIVAMRFQSGIDARLDDYFNPQEGSKQSSLFCQPLQ